MRDYYCIGATPIEEECAQVGTSDYHERALPECQRFMALLRRVFGPEPAGAQFQVMAFAHDFGTYHEVVCWFDTEIPESVAYACRVEDETPATWEG